MTFSTTLQFRGFNPSDALRASIDEQVSRLVAFDSAVRWCRVVVSAERHPQRNADLYRVELHVLVPGREIHVGRTYGHDPRHEDPFTAVADAFRTARRCAETAADRRRQSPRRRRDAPKSA